MALDFTSLLGRPRGAGGRGTTAPPPNTIATSTAPPIGTHDRGATHLGGPIPFGIPPGPITDVGLQTLMQVLMGQGATDPARLNLDLADIGNTTNQRQNAVTAQAAQQGTGASGVMQAIEQSVGVAGDNTRADRLATETQLTEQRMRDDIMRLLFPFFDFGIQGQALASGQFNQDRARSDQRDAARNAFIPDLIGSIAGFL